MNKVELVGRLTRDPELKSTQSGISVCTFGIAVDRRVRKDGSTAQQTADFFNVTAWRRQAELISQYFTKGRQIALDGRLQQHIYEAQDGTRRNVVEIVLENFDFISDRGAAPVLPEQPEQMTPPQPQGNPPKRGQAGRQQAVMNDSRLDDFDDPDFVLMADDDDVPF